MGPRTLEFHILRKDILQHRKTLPNRNRQLHSQNCLCFWKVSSMALSLYAWFSFHTFLSFPVKYHEWWFVFHRFWICISTLLYHGGFLRLKVRKQCKVSFQIQRLQRASCCLDVKGVSWFKFLWWDTLFLFIHCRLLLLRRLWLHTYFYLRAFLRGKQRQSFLFQFYLKPWIVHENLFG